MLNKISEKVKKGKFSFLYLFEDIINNNDLENIRLEIVRQGSDSFDFFLYNLYHMNVEYSLCLISFLREKIGKANDRYQLHKHINNFLNYELSDKNRHSLWKFFKFHCQYFGLSTSPEYDENRNFIVNEIRRQMGIPDVYIEKLTTLMLRFAENVGLPNIEDHNEVSDWKSDFCSHYSNQLQNFILNSLFEDQHNSYATKFLEIFNGKKDCKFNFEKIMLETIEEGSSNACFGFFNTPKIIADDNQIKLFLPGETEWNVSAETENGEETLLNEYLFFDDFIVLHDFIYTLKAKTQNTEWQKSLWQENTKRDILIFTQESKYIGSKSPGNDESIPLEHGEYLCFSKVPMCEESFCIDYDIELFLTDFCLNSKNKFVQFDKMPEYKFVLKEIPRIEVQNEPFIDKSKLLFYSDTGLRINVYLPLVEDIKDNAIVLKIINTFNNESVEIKSFLEDKNSLMDISEALIDFPKGFYKYRLEVYFRNKIQARKMINIWTGLKEVRNDCFYYKCKPENLLLDISSNLKIDNSSGCIEPDNSTQPYMKLCFSANNSEIKTINWIRDDIFIYINRYDSETSTEIPLEIGSTIAVKSNSRAQLIIYSTRNTNLQIGNYSKKLDFGRKCREAIQLSSIVDNIDSANSTLMFKRDDYSEYHPLLHIVSLFSVKSFETVKYDLNQAEYNIGINSEPEAIYVSYFEMLNNTKESETLFLTKELNTGKYLKVLFDGDINLFFDSKDFEDGWWFLEIMVLVNGKWGRLTNNREDFYSMVLVVRENKFIQNPDLYNLEYTDQFRLFKDINEKLKYCYSPEVWKSIGWLKNAWKNLLNGLISQNNCETLSEIFCLSLDNSAAGTPETWFPLLHIGAANPAVYTIDFKKLKNINYKGDHYNSIIVNNLSSIHNMEIVKNIVCLPTFFGSYSNAADLQRDKDITPKDFVPSKFKQILLMDIDNDKNKILSNHHYKYTINAMKQDYLRSLEFGNEKRRSIAINFSRKIQSMSFNESYLSKYFQWAIEIKPKYTELFPGIERDEYSEALNIKDYINDFAAFLSVFAMSCRLKNRKNDSYYLIFNNFNEEERFTALSYILQIGESTFLYYLFLWELILKYEFEWGRGK